MKKITSFSLFYLLFLLSLSTYAQNIVSTNPSLNANQVAVDANLSITFDTVITPSLFNEISITVPGAQTGTIAGTFSGVNTNTITFNPDQNFKNGELISISASSSFGGLVGSFTTATTPSGSGEFTEGQNIITTDADNAFNVYAADLDSDGFVDVLSASIDDNKIAWYKNDGNGNFGMQQIITTDVNEAWSVYATDIDGDGDLDVLSASAGDDRLAWYANDGNGNFGSQQTITTNENLTRRISAADIDGDGDMDVFSNSLNTNRITWYENVNNGTSWTQRFVSNEDAPGNGIQAADLDNDGDLDIITGGIVENEKIWFQNDGNGNFGPKQIINTLENGTVNMHTADLDNDGDLDLLTTGFTEIAWYENDRTGVFEDQQIVSSNVFSAFDVYASDMDGDGDMDVISASIDNKIAWYENDGSGAFGPQQIITTATLSPSAVYAADLDNDGDMDVLSASRSDNKIAWYENNTTRLFLSSTPLQNEINIANNQNIILSFDTAVLSGIVNTNNIVITGNQTAPIAGTFSGQDTNTITFNPNSDFKPGEIISVSVTNSIVTNPTVLRFTTSVSPDSPGEFANGENVISSAANGARDVISADIDGDGDLDVLSASEFDDKIAWYANDGSGNFGTAQNISTSANGAQSVTTADIDGDGDLDVLSASAVDDTIAWYANDGSGNFGTAQNISTSANGATDVIAADIDGDGDLDVLSASFNDDTIAWYANDGLGNFGVAQNISTSADGAQSVTAGDIDGDGDLDVLSASIIDDKIAWYENVSPPDCLDATTYTIAGGWDNGDPTETKTAIIAESYSTSLGNITACSLVILDGAILTVEADTFVQIENDISVDGYLLVAHTGSVVQIDDDAVVTGAGSFSVLVDTPDLDVRDFMIMGSPMDAETRENVWASAWNVQNYTPANFNPVVAVTDAYNFADAELDDWNLYTTGPLAAGEGFLVRPQTSLNGAGGVFAYDYNTGFLTNGVVTRPLNYNTTQLDSPNMLSNPYPSAIDADVFLDPIINPDIDAVYFWEHILAPDPSFPGSSTTGPNYSMGDVSFYNAMGGIGSASGSATPSNVISTAQGFGIFSNNPAGGTATFNNSMRLTTGNNTLRAPEVNRNRLWLHITSEAYGVGGTTLVGFTENATAGFDRRYDSQRVATHVSLFSHIDTNDTGYAIQGREVFNTEMTIALGFSSIIEEETSYTISLSDFDGIAWETNSPYLEDTITGIVTNLNESSYRFTSDSGVFNNRFILKFKDREVLDIVENTLSQITILPNPTTGLVIVNSPLAMITTISVLDVRGRVILRSNNVADFNRQIDLSNLSSAVYFINVSTENGTVLKKIIKN